MPTSSQAMILRSTEVSGSRLQRSFLRYHFFPIKFSMGNEPADVNVSRPPRSSPPVRGGEQVHLDVCVSGDPVKSFGGFEGVFSYDKATNAYRWQIFSVSPRPSQNLATETYGDDIQYGISRESSDHNVHFTTPSLSLTETSVFNEPDQNYTDQYLPLGHLNETEDRIYRRLEVLGFRRRPIGTQSGPSIANRRRQGDEPSSAEKLKSPKKCSSEPMGQPSSEPKLTVRYLNGLTLHRTTLPSTGFHPLLAAGESTKRRIPQVKQKSLLEEIKNSVKWENRVHPGTLLWSRDSLESPEISSAVCFSFRDSWKYDHARLKDFLESQFQCKVKNLRYDPVSLRASDPTVLDRWIVTLNSKFDCVRAVERGLSVGEDRVIVRYWDDIVREEREERWICPDSCRLPSERHERIIQKFLQVH